MSNEERQNLLRDAAEDLLLPLARLCVSQGLPFGQTEELLKRAYVRAAREARRDDGGASGRDMSQVSVSTGLSRREVTRISAELLPRAAQRPAPAIQLFLRWTSDRKLRGRDGQPKALPRSGKAPSFESLAASITRHVHARSLLDELGRLGLAELSEDGQTVHLLHDRFVPQHDDKRLFGLLAANVGDHLEAAVANVIHHDSRHFEQAVFADNLSQVSAEALRGIAQQQWRGVIASLVPELERMIAEDQEQGRPPAHRARLGMYTFHEPLIKDEHDEKDKHT